VAIADEVYRSYITPPCAMGQEVLGRGSSLCEGTAMRSGQAVLLGSKPVSSLQSALDLDLPVARITPKARPKARSRRSSTRRARGSAPLSPAAAVATFHAAFDLPRQALPSVAVPHELAQLRIALLEEEVNEFIVATRARDMAGIADALADIVYVAYGAALTYGIDLDLVLAEVHRANMSKLDHRGQPVKRADGKVTKSDRYRPPDVRSVLQLQLPLPLG